MPRQKTGQLTPLELEIMKVLWETGAANVQTVQGKLDRELAYTTVQTMLNVLHRKGKVKRELKEKAYFYRPSVTKRQVLGQTLGDIVDRMFGGSAESLVMSLLETRRLTPETLSRLNALVDEEAKDGKDK
ncbi:MAG TPA: BlaI/MecI/CopY family transcriptional regulator [Pyrinomonadaceae bacterium]|jgi:predicted transcriptional regulator